MDVVEEGGWMWWKRMDGCGGGGWMDVVEEGGWMWWRENGCGGGRVAVVEGEWLCGGRVAVWRVDGCGGGRWVAVVKW